MQNDVFMFEYTWLNNVTSRLGWGELETNLLLVGMTDVVTPAHYDEMENFFVQVAHFRMLVPSTTQNGNNHFTD